MAKSEQAPRFNLEIKLLDPDPERTRRLVEDAGATFVALLEQEDRFYRASGERLKVRRQTGDEPQVIRYVRPDHQGARVSRYEIIPLAVFDGPLRLGATPEIARVSKRRSLYLLGSVRIHLDDVAGLGCFVEFEAVSDSAGEAAYRQEELLTLQRRIGLGSESAIAGSYADLLAASS